MDLEKFQQFKRKFDTNFAGKSGSSGQSGAQIKWPSSSGQARKPVEDDDDLYS